MTTTYFVVPGAGHVVDGLDGGLQEGVTVLYRVLGFSAPQRTSLRRLRSERAEGGDCG